MDFILWYRMYCVIMDRWKNTFCTSEPRDEYMKNEIKFDCYNRYNIYMNIEMKGIKLIINKYNYFQYFFLIVNEH